VARGADHLLYLTLDLRFQDSKGQQAGEPAGFAAEKFEMVINLKTAKALRLEVPDKLLALAAEVIE
jgi:hypothetical protein